MNKKGQALVEFIIILPITLLLVFCVIDFGRVISLKSDLESKASDVVMFYENGNTPDEILNLINKNKNEEDKINLDIKTSGYYATIEVSKKIKPITPGLNYLKTDVFNVKVSRVIRNE